MNMQIPAIFILIWIPVCCLASEDLRNEQSTVRNRRDGYGGYGGYGGSGYSSYSCDSSNPLLFFGIGSLLGFLLSMMPMMSMMMMNTTGGRAYDEGSIFSPKEKYIETKLQIAVESVEDKPECKQRLLCQVMQQLMKEDPFKEEPQALKSYLLTWASGKSKDLLSSLLNSDQYLTSNYKCENASPKCLLTIPNPARKPKI